MPESSLPEDDVQRVERWCRAQVPEHMRDQVRVECDRAPRHLTIVERRPHNPGTPGDHWMTDQVARFRYTKKTGTWMLYWRDRNLEFHEYWDFEPTPDIGVLIEEVAADPTCIFWG